MFTTPVMGDDNAIARHGIHGLQWSLEFAIGGHLLVQGDNAIDIKVVQAGAGGPAAARISGVMYDYIRLERPSSGGALKLAPIGRVWMEILFLCSVAFLVMSQ